MDVQEAISRAKKTLEENRTMDAPSLAAGYFRGVPEVEEAGLGELTYLLSSPFQNCHRNDVLGLIELLEAFLAKREPTNDANQEV